jgi:hypothetical protein
MTNYYKGHRQEGFPAPKARVTSHSPLWDWAAVAAWLYKHGRISKEEAIEAGVLSAANDLLECGASLPGTLEKRAEQLEAALG